MSEIERSMGGVDRAAKSAGLQTGRLGNQFAGLAGQIAHVHPIVGNLAGVLGNFAIGATMTVGILAGVAAIALAYDALTKSAREAKEANDKLVKSLQDSNFKASLGSDPELRLQVDAQRNELMRLRERKRVLESFGGAAAGPKAAEELLDLDVQILHAKTQLEIGEARLKKAGASTVVVAAKVVEATTKAVESMEDWWTRQQNIWDKATARAEAFNTLMFGTGEPFSFAVPDVVMPTIEGPDPDAIKQAEQIHKDLGENAHVIRDAVWGAAAQSANMIVNALNIGGGGKGSSLGGGIGGSLGFAAGFIMGGPAGGAVGSLIGNIGGSLIGGLFDHKKAIDINTNAVKQNTAALLLNSPSGYKTASGRFDATDVKDFRRGLQRYATRGGAPILVAP